MKAAVKRRGAWISTAHTQRTDTTWRESWALNNSYNTHTHLHQQQSISILRHYSYLTCIFPLTYFSGALNPPAGSSPSGCSRVVYCTIVWSNLSLILAKSLKALEVPYLAAVLWWMWYWERNIWICDKRTHQSVAVPDTAHEQNQEPPFLWIFFLLKKCETLINQRWLSSKIKVFIFIYIFCQKIRNVLFSASL